MSVSDIEQWIQRQGYPFELLVGRRFQRHGFTVEHARHFVDRDGERPKARRIDVYATKAELTSAGDAIASLSFAVECTYSPCGWVVFSSASPLSGFGVSTEQYVAGEISREMVRVLDGLNAPLGVLSAGASRTGHYVIQVDTKTKKNEPESTPRKAILDAVAAASTMCRYFDEIQADYPAVPHAALILPAVVLRGQLFEAHLEDTDKMSVAEIDRIGIVVEATMPPGELRLVNLVSEVGLEDFLGVASNDADNVREFVLPRTSDIVRAAGQRTLMQKYSS